MEKFYSALLYLGVILGLFTSCHDDKHPIIPQIELISTTGDFAVAQEDTLILKARLNHPINAIFSWTMNGKEVSTDTIYKFIATELGSYQLSVKAVTIEGEEAIAQSTINVHGKYKYGTFVLSEGSMSAGSLTFISPRGKVIDNAYELENGEKLGVISQDLFIKNNKLYIVSQNGGNGGGYLTVVNAETLKKEQYFQYELDGKVSRPTHVAVLDDDDIYLRDGKGIKRFQPSTGSVTLIEGSERARINTMVVSNNKVFSTIGKDVIVIEQGKNSISHTIKFEATVSGIVKASDGNLWVSDANGNIHKINTNDYTEIGNNYVGDEAKNTLSAGWASTPSITAKGDTLYTNGSGTKIYRHVFSTGETKLMVDVKDMVENANIVYNTTAVNPRTGEVIFNSIKGYSPDHKINNISVFDFSGEEPTLNANYENYTEYPAGIFFTYNFE